MNLKTLLEAEDEALNFLRRSKEVRVRAQNDEYAFYGCKETSALRRQSLELTRALARMRKP